MVFNDQNSVDEASRIVMFFFLNFHNLCFEYRKSFMDGILQGLEFIFAKGFLNLIEVLFEDQKGNVFLEMVCTLKSINSFNHVKLFNQPQVN
jgi:hypothetical protein